MTEQQILLGSLSSDLFRIANFIQTGSTKAAERFWLETKRWIADLKKEDNPQQISEILSGLENMDFDPSSFEQRERLLTYAEILQRLALDGVSQLINENNYCE